MKTAIRLLTLLPIAAALCCVNPKKDSEPIVYEEQVSVPLDSVGSWIEQPDHYLLPEFHPFFWQHFNQQLEAGRIDSAAHLLSIAGKAACMNYVFDTLLANTSMEFLQKYERQLPDQFRAGIYCNLGDLYGSVDNFEISNAYFYKSMDIVSKDYETELHVAASKSGLMYNFQNTGKLDSALLVGYSALESFERLKNASGKMAIYTTLSGVYKYQGDYKESEKLGDMAKDIALESKDSISIYIAYADKIALYDEINHPDLLPWIDSLYQFYTSWKPKNPGYQLGAQSWYALKLVRENKLAEANKILQKVWPLVVAVEDTYFIDDYLYALAEYNLKSNKSIDNPERFEEKLPLLQENQDYNRLILFNDVLSKNALLQNDYRNAYRFNQASEAARDSLRKEEIRAQVKELDKKYQTEKKEQQIALQNSQLQRQKVQIGLLIAGIIALLLTAVAAYLLFQQKRSRKESSRQLKFTKQLLENTEEERSRIANDLHDSVSSDLLHLKNTIRKELTGPEVGIKIDDIINEIRQISRNLHPVMLDKIGLKLSLETLCEQFMQHETMYVSHEIDYQNTLPKSSELQLFRIVQEGLTNAMKYARAEAVKVHLEHSDNALRLEIKDNGQGFAVEKALESGKAFGLHSIIQRAKAIGGKADIQSTETGTIIRVVIDA